MQLAKKSMHYCEQSKTAQTKQNDMGTEDQIHEQIAKAKILVANRLNYNLKILNHLSWNRRIHSAFGGLHNGMYLQFVTLLQVPCEPQFQYL